MQKLTSHAIITETFAKFVSDDKENRFGIFQFLLEEILDFESYFITWNTFIIAIIESPFPLL